MKFTTYKNIDGGVGMISEENAISEIRELGHIFAVALAERGHETTENDLMNGMAAYNILQLTGVNPRIDAAHRVVMKLIADRVVALVRASSK